MLETIKSYLVSLGFAVDGNSYNQATKAMDKAGESVAKFAGSAVTRFAVAGAAVTSFVATAVVGIAKFIGGLGEAQIQNEKLARQWWISEDSAMAFNSTLKALHASLQDLYLSPTLANQFQELMKESNSLKPPAEFKNQMQLVQSINFEFKRMKLEATYALQWIGYYFIKYMQGPIIKIKVALAEINDTIIKKMPYWTKIVAEVMSWFARMGIATVRAIEDIKRVFDDIGKSIPNNLKLIGGALAALGLILKTGPLGILIAIFTAAILLLDDFYTYLDGGQSAFAPFWKKLIEVYDKLKEAGGLIDRFKNTFTDAFSELGKVLENHKGLWDDLKTLAMDFGNMVKDALDFLQGPLDWIGKTGLPTVLDAILNATEGVTEFLHEMDQFGATEAIIAGVGAAWATYKGILIAVETWTKLVTAAQWLWNIAMDANPVGIIVIAVGLLVAGLVLLAKHWDTVKKAAMDSLNWIIDKLNYLIKLIDKIPGIKIPLIPSLSGGDGATASSYTPSYMYPQSNTQNNNKNNITLSQVNNMYGSDPKTTADAAQDNMNQFYMRGMKGMYV